MDPEIRPAEKLDVDAIAAIETAASCRAYGGFVPVDELVKVSRAESAAAWESAISSGSQWPCQAFVAEQAGKVVGFASCGQFGAWEGYDGVLNALYVDPSHHRQGIGGLLFDRAMTWLGARGVGGAYVEVYRDNPFRKFYDARGGEVIGEFGVSAYGQTIPAVAYGWKGIT
jgi:L-amino acid N-acyltransferase YncA